MRRTLRLVAVLSTFVFAAGLTATPAPSASLGTEVLRGAAIGLAVKLAAKPLNDFINTVTLRNKMQTSFGTKVVPILSVGEKGYVGAAQVAGPATLVQQVQAVFQYEKNFDTNNYRVKALVPSGSLNPLELKRVEKVGVSAIIDVSLDGRWRGQSVGTGIQVGDVIRGAAVIVAVRSAATMLNTGINAITFNKGLATKVVPMGSIGEKAYIGGAQVSASALSIGQVNAVWQYEDLFDGGKFRVKIVVPTTSSNPLQMKRVDGAGVTAVIDMALSQQKQPETRPVRNTGIGGFIPGVGGRDDDRRDDDDDDRYRRGDNGKHKGWERGKRKGHDKKKDRD